MTIARALVLNHAMKRRFAWRFGKNCIMRGFLGRQVEIVAGNHCGYPYPKLPVPKRIKDSQSRGSGPEDHGWNAPPPEARECLPSKRSRQHYSRRAKRPRRHYNRSRIVLRVVPEKSAT